jgi:hypothetical protein
MIRIRYPRKRPIIFTQIECETTCNLTNTERVVSDEEYDR